MGEIIAKYATAAATALFAVVALSGIAMFLHVGKGLVAELHEWLAMVFVAVAGLHVWRNWNAFMGYFRRGTIAVPGAVTAVAALLFIVPAALGGHSEPMPRLFQAIESARVADVAQLAGAPSETFTQALKAAGFLVRSADQRVTEIASQSGKPARMAVFVIMDAFPAER